MKSILIAFMAVALLGSVALADTTVEGIYNARQINQQQDRIVTDDADYNPQLEITIPHQMDMTPMEISSDGNNYYAINGGNASYGVVEKYDFNGNYIQSVSSNLDTRALFYNANDGNFYCKNYGQDLIQIDVETGTNSIVFSNIFHNYQSKLAYNPADNYIYEMVEGTVYVVDFANGNLVNTMYGFQYNGWGHNWCIATNGVHLFTWDDSWDCYAYEYDGTFVEQFHIPSGSCEWAFGFANNLLFTGDAQGMGSQWYGHSGVEGVVEDTCLAIGITIRTPHVPSVNGNIMFSLNVRNCGQYPLPVYAEIYPTIGDCNSGTPFNLDIIRMLRAALPAGESFAGNYFYNVGDVSGLNLSLCAVTVDVGYAANTYLDQDCDEFMFHNPWARSSGPAEWGTEWREVTDNLPVTTSLHQNYPNPFNAVTNIEFELAVPGDVQLGVYNVAGQLVENLLNGSLDAGNHSVSWDASRYASGVYFYKLITAQNVATRRMVLLK